MVTLKIDSRTTWQAKIDPRTARCKLLKTTPNQET